MMADDDPNRRAKEQIVEGVKRLERWAYGEREPWEADVQRLMDAGKVDEAQNIILDHVARKLANDE